MSQTQARTGAVERQANARGVFRDTLALFVGAGRRYQVDELSADTIRRYLRGETCPEWPNAVLIMGALPVEFSAAVLRPAGLAGLRRIEGETSAAETMAGIARGTATLADALADGRIDHTEWPALRRDLTAAMVAIAQLLQERDRA